MCAKERVSQVWTYADRAAASRVLQDLAVNLLQEVGGEKHGKKLNTLMLILLLEKSLGWFLSAFLPYCILHIRLEVSVCHPVLHNTSLIV